MLQTQFQVDDIIDDKKSLQSARGEGADEAVEAIVEYAINLRNEEKAKASVNEIFKTLESAGLTQLEKAMKSVGLEVPIKDDKKAEETMIEFATRWIAFDRGMGLMGENANVCE